jgi:uncharacterized protein YacL
MKRLIIQLIICIIIGIIVATVLSILGHYNIWIFTNSIRTNFFIVGVFYLIIGYFSYQSTNEHDRVMTVFTSISKYAKPDYEGFNNKISSLLIFVSLGLLFGSMYLILPEIRV